MIAFVISGSSPAIDLLNNLTRPATFANLTYLGSQSRTMPVCDTDLSIFIKGDRAPSFFKGPLFQEYVSKGTIESRSIEYKFVTDSLCIVGSF